MSNTSAKPAVLITGASSGIGATYADRFARRGHDLVLVARDEKRLTELALRLRQEYGVAVDIVPADLTDESALSNIELRLAKDSHIGILVNNAGIATAGGFAGTDGATLHRLIQLNVLAVARLAGAILQRLTQEGGGAIINIGSVVGLAPELGMGAYGATKAFVLALSQSLHVEAGPKGVYTQAVLPAATRTEIWERSGLDISAIEGVMEVGELVDAALVGFDRREPVTIPPLPDAAQWDALEAARQAMLPNFRQKHAAMRYREGALAAA